MLVYSYIWSVLCVSSEMLPCITSVLDITMKPLIIIMMWAEGEGEEDYILKCQNIPALSLTCSIAINWYWIQTAKSLEVKVVWMSTLNFQPGQNRGTIVHIIYAYVLSLYHSFVVPNWGNLSVILQNRRHAVLRNHAHGRYNLYPMKPIFYCFVCWAQH